MIPEIRVAIKPTMKPPKAKKVKKDSMNSMTP